MSELCPIKRTVGIVPVQGKPPPNQLVVSDNQMGLQIIKVQDEHHEYLRNAVDEYVCKFCLRIVRLGEVPTQ